MHGRLHLKHEKLYLIFWGEDYPASKSLSGTAGRIIGS